MNKEVSIGRNLGPLTNIPILTLHISLIGVIPKPDGTWRLVTNLSHPISDSINSDIDEKYSKVCYSSLDNILDKLYDLGKGALLGKIDIKSAFKLLLINPADLYLLGIFYNGTSYIDKCLSMGCSVSCSLFDKLSTFLHWVVQFRTGLDTIDHYLDDFSFMGADSSEDCLNLMSSFQNLC